MTSANITTQSQSTKSSFIVQGDQCAATLWTPEGSKETDKLPAILMIHGWGGIQMVLFKEFIRRFNDAGFAVMTFDFPGWGDSAGWPRNQISPWKRVRTAGAALAHLKQQNNIDATRIVAWGTSFGGGHAVDLAANHPELAGVVAHVPMLNGLSAIKAISIPRILRFAVDITRDIINPFGQRYIPVVSPEGEYSTMDRDGAERIINWVDEHMDGKYDNRITARSLLTMGFYHPRFNLKNIKIPALIIGALQDSVAPFNKKAVEKIVGENAQIHTLDANHFDPYLPPFIDDNIARQLEFLKSIVK